MKNSGKDTKELKIEYISTKEILPYINNSRVHTTEQVKQVAASIQEFGFNNPILIDENKSVIAGHGRLLASELLEITKVPTITLKGLTEAQRKAYVLADNQLALNADWDIEKLKIEIENLEGLDFNLDLVGFEKDFLDQIKVDIPDLDYSLLNDEGASSAAEEISAAGKKAIQIEFDIEDYERAYDLISSIRKQTNLGALIIHLLEKAKSELSVGNEDVA